MKRPSGWGSNYWTFLHESKVRVHLSKDRVNQKLSERDIYQCREESFQILHELQVSLARDNSVDGSAEAIESVLKTYLLLERHS